MNIEKKNTDGINLTIIDVIEMTILLIHKILWSFF